VGRSRAGRFGFVVLQLARTAPEEALEAETAQVTLETVQVRLDHRQDAV
jgi:hypothetical protein